MAPNPDWARLGARLRQLPNRDIDYTSTPTTLRMLLELGYQRRQLDIKPIESHSQRIGGRGKGGDGEAVDLGLASRVIARFSRTRTA